MTFRTKKTWTKFWSFFFGEFLVIIVVSRVISKFKNKKLSLWTLFLFQIQLKILSLIFFPRHLQCLRIVIKPSEVVARSCSVKKVFLEISQNSREKTCARFSFSIKLQALARNFIKKETLAQIFSYEFCEISKNAFSHRTPPLAVSQVFFNFPWKHQKTTGFDVLKGDNSFWGIVTV